MYLQTDVYTMFCKANTSCWFGGTFSRLTKFRLGANTLCVKTNRKLVPKPPGEQRVCKCRTMQAIDLSSTMSNFLYSTALLTVLDSLGGNTFLCLVQNTNSGTWLFFEQSQLSPAGFHQLQLGYVAHHFHLCFQARMSDEPHLAPRPRL